MKFTDEQFHELFGPLIKLHEVVGYSEKDNQTWNEGYSFAFSQLYDLLVVTGEDEDDKYFESLERLTDG